MSDEIKVGDRFLVEVEVVAERRPNGVLWVLVTAAGRTGEVPVPTAWLASAKRLPRPLRVGDRVTEAGVHGVAVIKAIDAPDAWTSYGERRRSPRLSDLTLAEESAS